MLKNYPKWVYRKQFGDLCHRLRQTFQRELFILYKHTKLDNNLRDNLFRSIFRLDET